MKKKLVILISGICILLLIGIYTTGNTFGCFIVKNNIQRYLKSNYANFEVTDVFYEYWLGFPNSKYGTYIVQINNIENQEKSINLSTDWLFDGSYKGEIKDKLSELKQDV